ncbi:hypothetical protein [Bacillus velezensis]|uniref:hypothetical protein n=1 Tax=Bacillus velezensis TaxID=492670 RepID=UPI00140A9861|nr:hypothetical protein [Bacillus velezensis]
MTENKNLRRHGEVTTRVMSEEERMEYIKKHPIIRRKNQKLECSSSRQNIGCKDGR